MEKERIYGIKCDVANCVYNRNACDCVAGTIDVVCTCAKPDCCNETACKTFKSKD